MQGTQQAMDFFGAQDVARRQTGRLVALFGLAVAGIVLVVYAAVLVAARGPEGAALGWWDGPLFALTAAGVLGGVALASGVRTLSLRRGGPAVAEMLGGRVLAPHSDDPDERRLTNVVEEMALAAGVPVPLVYVLEEEPGINAFAAGTGPEDAVVAVTAGALRHLTRDELQGVVAHEFSHILNRDVRLNLRLTGLLFGILALGLAGRLLLRSRGRRGRGAGAVLLVGLALFVAGYVGVFLGRLIRAAVSRQREFLADAAAVQFTRNPEGLAGALRKIAAHAEGSRIESASAEEVSHFFFANGLRGGLAGRLWATHPPLEERIRRLAPGAEVPSGRGRGSPQGAGMAGSAGMAGLAAASAAPPRPGGLPTEATATVLGRIPPVLHEALGSAFGAVAVICALMLDPDETVRAAQTERLAAALEEPLYREVLRLGPAVEGLAPEARLPLADLATPALRQLAPAQAQALEEALTSLAFADAHVSVFEFALRTIVRYRMARARGEERTEGRAPLEAVLPEALVLLSALAFAGQPPGAAVRAAFEAGAAALTPEAHAPVPATAGDLDGVLERIAGAAPEVRARVLEACSRTVMADGVVTPAEGQLLRAIAVALAVPPPAFLARLEAARW